MCRPRQFSLQLHEHLVNVFSLVENPFRENRKLPEVEFFVEQAGLLVVGARTEEALTLNTSYLKLLTIMASSELTSYDFLEPFLYLILLLGWQSKRVKLSFPHK